MLLNIMDKDVTDLCSEVPPQILAQKSTILNQVSVVFLQANTKIVPQIKLGPLPSTSFPTDHSIIIKLSKLVQQ